MQASKITLSPAEAALFCNAEVILTKNSVLKKTAALLAQLQEVLLKEQLFIGSPPPKISRGENYLGLPYVVLDYPRIADPNGLLFIRSFFWWGHFYSSTLHLSGGYQQKTIGALSAAYKALKEEDYFIGIHPDPWVHHFGADNYCSLDELSEAAYRLLLLQEREHTKIAARWPLQSWDSAGDKLMKSWRILAGLVA